VDFDHSIKNQKSTFVSLFPSTYNREQLDKLDDDGIVKVGMQVNKGDPLVLLSQLMERDKE
jgi:DNA-directed RNA polymerase beta subunit